jgi:hypothetical protein
MWWKKGGKHTGGCVGCIIGAAKAPEASTRGIVVGAEAPKSSTKRHVDSIQESFGEVKSRICEEERVRRV